MDLIIRQLGLQDYQKTWQAMRDFTEKRADSTADEFWLVQHPSVYTQGLSGKAEHLLNPQTIPVVQTDRGGQVTYHGPGQLILYPLIDLKRKNLGIRALVSALENSTIALLKQYGLQAYARADAPGVYINEEKIASLGLRVRRGCSYHGLSLNVDLDLTPFDGINPCGQSGLSVTSLAKLGINIKADEPAPALIAALINTLDYDLDSVTSK
ncbi:MAG: octanoyltransferase [Gammaproteobacteria bacterium]|nr:MAG: octanoyltransferase [Gammaproteobacteria bacterium]